MGSDGRPLRDPRRDYTACHIVAVDLNALSDPGIGRPRYRVVQTRVWRGTRVPALLAQLRAFLEPGAPRYIVADATGVGQGLVSFLSSPVVFGDKVVPFHFTPVSKAGLGSAFLALVESVPEGEGAFDRALR